MQPEVEPGHRDHAGARMQAQLDIAFSDKGFRDAERGRIAFTIASIAAPLRTHERDAACCLPNPLCLPGLLPSINRSLRRVKRAGAVLFDRCPTMP